MLQNFELKVQIVNVPEEESCFSKTSIFLPQAQNLGPQKCLLELSSYTHIANVSDCLQKGGGGSCTGVSSCRKRNISSQSPELPIIYVFFLFSLSGLLR